MKRNLVVAALVAVALTVVGLTYAVMRPDQMHQLAQMHQMPPSTGGSAPTGSGVPSVNGYMEGQEIRFIQTEASDPQIAQHRSTAMRTPMLVVPALAQVPEAALANVYVFTNGTRGGGPFGFQLDVFDGQPGTDGYRPLRAVNLVTWLNAASARELRSVTEVRAAESGREVSIVRPGVVVNMPLVTGCDSLL